MRKLFFVAAALALAGCDEVVRVEPGANLGAVRDRIRAWRAEDAARANEKVTVELAAGRYELKGPVALGPEDSHVEWRAAPGAEVRLAGGLLVTTPPAPVADREILGLLPEKARGKVVEYDLAALGVTDWGDYLYNLEDGIQRRVANMWGQGEFVKGSHPPPKGYGSVGRMELFVDDRPLAVARSAKGVVYHIESLTGPVIEEKCREQGRSKVGKFVAKEEIPSAWAKEPDPFVCGCWCHDWAEQHQRIEKLDLATRAFELSKPYHQYLYAKGAYFYGFNMLCELDEPGEWYIHRKSGKLVVWMPEGEGGAPRVELSMASRLFELEGATDVVFRGLIFETCRNSAVRMKDCRRCLVEDCTIRNVGHHAVIVEDGEACGVRGSRLYGMGGGGVWLADGNRESLKPSGHFVEDCDIHDFGRWNRMYRPGVCLSGVGMRAERNRIHDSPHAAVLYFGCNLTMRSNEVYRVCRGSKDCGAFYSGRSWMLRGNRIEGNYIHDVIGLDGAMTRTVYLDDSIAQVDVVGNRFERCTWAIFIGGARECVVTNNVFVDCPGAIYVDKRGMNWQKPHIDGRLKELAAKGTVYGLSCRKGPYVDAFPAVKDLPGPNPYEPVLNVIAHNKFIRGKAEWIEKYAPKMKGDPRWWRSGEVKDEELVKWGVFEDNVVDNAGLVPPAAVGRWRIPDYVDVRIGEALARYRAWKGSDETVVIPTITDVHSWIAEIADPPDFSDKKMHVLYCIRAGQAFGADFLAHLGDTGMDICRSDNTPGDESHMRRRLASERELMSAADLPWLFVFGNHERGNRNHLMKNGEIGRFFNAPELTRSLMPTMGPDADYGYVDLRGKRTRVFFLNTTQAHPRPGYRMGDDQLEFLERGLADVPKGWTVLVLSHYCLHPWLGAWWDVDDEGRPVNRNKPNPSIDRCRILLERFAARTDVRLAGAVCGDSHFDNAAVLNGVRYVVSQGYGYCNPKSIAPGGSRFPGGTGRVDTRNDLLIDVVAVKPATGEMKVFRVGTDGRMKP